MTITIPRWLLWLALAMAIPALIHASLGLLSEPYCDGYFYACCGTALVVFGAWIGVPVGVVWLGIYFGLRWFRASS